MVSSLASHEEDCHHHYSRSHCGFIQPHHEHQAEICAPVEARVLLQHHPPRDIIFPHVQPPMWQSMTTAIMPAATTTQNLVLPSLWLLLKQLYKTATGSAFTLSSGLTSALVPRTSLNLRDASPSFWCPDHSAMKKKRLYRKGKQRHLAWWTGCWHGWQHFLRYFSH